jgi:hypothetical protein
MTRFSGVWLPAITPFEDGEIDCPSYERLVDHYVQAGVAGIIPLGTTGESPTIGEAESAALVERTVSVVAGRVPVVAGLGGNDTRSGDPLSHEPERGSARLAPVRRLDHSVPRDNVACVLDLLALTGGASALLDHGQLGLGRHGDRNSDVDVHDGLRENCSPRVGALHDRVARQNLCRLYVFDLIDPDPRGHGGDSFSPTQEISDAHGRPAPSAPARSANA